MWTSSLGQLRSTYTLKGVAEETTGRVRFKSQIILHSDNSFLWISEKYNYKDKTFISADSSIGKWTTDNRILNLDHTPTTINREYDTYVIKNRKLKRTTIKGKWTIYKASGDIIKVAGLRDK